MACAHAPTGPPNFDLMTNEEIVHEIQRLQRMLKAARSSVAAKRSAMPTKSLPSSTTWTNKAQQQQQQQQSQSQLQPQQPTPTVRPTVISNQKYKYELPKPTKQPQPTISATRYSISSQSTHLHYPAVPHPSQTKFNRLMQYPPKPNPQPVTKYSKIPTPSKLRLNLTKPKIPTPSKLKLVLKPPATASQLRLNSRTHTIPTPSKLKLNLKSPSIPTPSKLKLNLMKSNPAQQKTSPSLNSQTTPPPTTQSPVIQTPASQTSTSTVQSDSTKVIGTPLKTGRQAAAKHVKLLLDRRKKQKQKTLCVFFTKYGKCFNGDNCSYIHDKDKVAICTKFLMGKCDNPNCTLSHKINKEQMPVCQFFLRGCCNNDNCPYSHVKVSPKAELCKDFLNGWCERGTSCKLLHTYECPAWSKTGSCPDGDQCRLHHRKKKL